MVSTLSLKEQAATARVVTDRGALRKPVEPTEISIDEAKEIAQIMLDRLDELGGVGLSANQLGLPIRLFVTNINEPMWFLNPRLVGVSTEEVGYYEACLSFPKTLVKPIKTKRHLAVQIEADNYGDVLQFQGQKKYESAEEYWSDKDLLQSIVVQHELDHLNGRLIFDHRVEKPVVSEKSYGRNDKVMFVNPKTGESKYIKYKKGEKLLTNGWEVA